VYAVDWKEKKTFVGSEEEDEQTKRLRERIKFCKDGIKERERERERDRERESREKLVSLKYKLQEYSSVEKGVETLVSNNHSLVKTSTLASLSACL